MKKTLILINLLCFSALLTMAQKLPSAEMHHFFKEIEKNKSWQKQSESSSALKEKKDIPSGAFQIVKKIKDLKLPSLSPNENRGDTLYVGLPPLDSLIITGEYFYAGNIFVVGNGVLRFKNANATILGDIYVWGDNALVTADSSYLSFPQQYFYQRSLVIAGHGKVIYRNTTLDHGDLPHNLVLTDSASIEMDNVTNKGFTTCGLNAKCQVSIDGTNQAGEFVITGQSSLRVKNAHTVLLWHQVASGGMLDFSFPDGDTVTSYQFNPDMPGVSGVDYTVDVQNCGDVMWALMPSGGSDITISDSKIRSVGLWFEGSDSLNVSGLVNNSDYSDFTTPLPDRNLRFVNTSVQTWSLYTMESSIVYLTGSIVGEIGSMARSKVQASNIYLDGSGGYWWATDTTFMISGFSTGVNDIRSNRNAIFLFAYSTLNSGIASAHEKSILILLQSQIPEEPVLYDNACIWNVRISGPSSAFVDSLVPVKGSAWIDKTASSPLMDFAWYRLYYQRADESVWHTLSSRIFNEKREEELISWDTHDLLPGGYNLKLELCDNSPDSNKVEAIKSINLQPKILGIGEQNSIKNTLIIFPNPANDILNIHIPMIYNDGNNSISIYNISGKEIKKIPLNGKKDNYQIDVSGMTEGLYFIVFYNEGRMIGSGKVVVSP